MPKKLRRPLVCEHQQTCRKEVHLACRARKPFLQRRQTFSRQMVTNIARPNVSETTGGPWPLRPRKGEGGFDSVHHHFWGVSQLTTDSLMPLPYNSILLRIEAALATG